MMKKSLVLTVLLALIAALSVMPAWAQGNMTTQISGKVTGKDGQPAVGVTVVYTSETNNRTFKMKTDKNGQFSTIGVTFGQYKVEVLDASGAQIFKDQTVVGGNAEERIMNIDLRGGSQSGLGGANNTPKYTKEQLESMKAANAKAGAQNALIKQYQDAFAAKNWPEATTALQGMIANEPNRYEFYRALGDVQFSSGQYEDALQTYNKSIQMAQADNTVDPKNPATDPAKKKANIAAMLTNEGNAYLKLKKNDDAIASFNKAAEMDPNPGTAYWNLCATQYNAGNGQGAVAACDKAIQADPNNANAYFIKGSSMIGLSDGKLDSQGHIIVPPGTIEALNKYLELQPDGPHAGEVKEMLTALGAKVETTYKERKKK